MYLEKLPVSCMEEDIYKKKEKKDLAQTLKFKSLWISLFFFFLKALSWCPWQPQLLASGGGTADRHIRFWSVATGSCLNAVDTNSQVKNIFLATDIVRIFL